MAENHQHIYGGVNINDTQFGEGFTHEKIGTGTYIVTFDNAFGKVPGVGCTVFEARDPLAIRITELGKTSFMCIIADMNGPVDAGFTFIAFGDK